MILKVIFYCEGCGREVEENAEVCSNCGRPVPRYFSQPEPEEILEPETKEIPESKEISKIPKCKYCGATLKQKAKFCTKCGTKL